MTETVWPRYENKRYSGGQKPLAWQTNLEFHVLFYSKFGNLELINKIKATGELGSCYYKSG